LTFGNAPHNRLPANTALRAARMKRSIEQQPIPNTENRCSQISTLGNFMTPKKIPDKFQTWIDARKKYHLSHAQIQMARELGMNPKNFGKLDNHRQEKWKLPLPEFIEELYFKRFGKVKPEQVASIEEKVMEIQRKGEEKKQRKRAKQESEIQQGSGELQTGSDS